MITSRGVVNTDARRRNLPGRQLGPPPVRCTHWLIEFHSAWVGAGMSWVFVTVWPPVSTVAVISGTLPFWCTAKQGESAGDVVDAVEPRDLRDLRGRERQLRGGQEQLTLEGRARLAELGEVGLEQRLVLVDQRVDFLGRQPAEQRGRARLPAPATGTSTGRETTRSVPTFARGSRISRLGLVEAGRQRADDHDQAHAHAEAEDREDRAARACGAARDADRSNRTRGPVRSGGVEGTVQAIWRAAGRRRLPAQVPCAA